MTSFVADDDALKALKLCGDESIKPSQSKFTLSELTALNDRIPDDVPVFAFFNKLSVPFENEVYKASAKFRAKTERLRIKQENAEYKRIIESVDPSQKYGKVNHMENFGNEMRAVNRQMISVINVVITVVGAFFFGFSGVTYAYPHREWDLTTRFVLGLVPATIVFFADLYFILKSMDGEEQSSFMTSDGKATLSFRELTEKQKTMEQKKKD